LKSEGILQHSGYFFNIILISLRADDSPLFFHPEKWQFIKGPQHVVGAKKGGHKTSKKVYNFLIYLLTKGIMSSIIYAVL
jgi:hypothetical protein